MFIFCVLASHPTRPKVSPLIISFNNILCFFHPRFLEMLVSMLNMGLLLTFCTKNRVFFFKKWKFLPHWCLFKFTCQKSVSRRLIVTKEEPLTLMSLQCYKRNKKFMHKKCLELISVEAIMSILTPPINLEDGWHLEKYQIWMLSTISQATHLPKSHWHNEVH
mgnify:CR=1 FL=1